MGQGAAGVVRESGATYLGLREATYYAVAPCGIVAASAFAHRW
jgi:hypothetical protein